MERSQIGHVDVVDDQRGDGDHLTSPSGHDGKEHEHHHEDDPKGAEERLRHDGEDHPRVDLRLGEDRDALSRGETHECQAGCCSKTFGEEDKLGDCMVVLLIIITRSYAALRAADLDWIVGPGYSPGG